MNPPLATSVRTSTIISNVSALNAYDFPSVEAAATWNNSHAMTLNSSTMPIAVQKIMFLKAGSQFLNTLYLDWNGGTTSTDVQFSFRDNSVTSGDFVNSAVATVPAFVFPTATFGGTGRTLNVTVTRAGRYSVALRVKDATNNWSLFEMEWIVLP